MDEEEFIKERIHQGKDSSSRLYRADFIEWALRSPETLAYSFNKSTVFSFGQSSVEKGRC